MMFSLQLWVACVCVIARAPPHVVIRTIGGDVIFMFHN